MSVITPGTYLRKRREAAGLSSAAVAAMIVTEPRLPEHDLIFWLDRIEADVVPATFRTIICLHCCFSFDIQVLEQLVVISMAGPDHATYPSPRLCRVCACSERDACVRERNIDDDIMYCGWAGDDICSACAARPAADLGGDA